LKQGIEYFLPNIILEPVGPSESHHPVMEWQKTEQGPVVDWLGTRHLLTGAPLTEAERRLVKSIGRVLSTRYRFLFDRELAAHGIEMFRGVPEDRYVSAFLDPLPYSAVLTRLETPDRIADAIEVLRISALTTYENRRIATGALIFGSQHDPCHAEPPLPPGAFAYSVALTSIRSFHRLCDGLQTLALVNKQGLLVELVDVQEWTHPFASMDLPVPEASRYESHCRATLCGGHTCLVLTPNNEIKVFANGSQVFNFIDGRWRLTDAVEKYQSWNAAIGDPEMAERLYRVALNLAEERRGGLFVTLEDASWAELLVAPGDLLESSAPDASDRGGSKDQLHYLLRGKSLRDVPATVLESVARIDGAIVFGPKFELLTFGAILRLGPSAESATGVAEGGRTNAAISASRFGNVLKISEDGIVAFYRKGQRVWEM
jgi:hypothetical protein